MPPIITNVDQKLLRTTKFPPEFSQKVDVSKVNIPVIKNWAAGEISRLLGFEDDVVIGLLFDRLESDKNPDIKSLQLQLTGFLGNDAASFCKTLWTLCLSAQTTDSGVPQQLLEAKKQELRQEREQQEQAAQEARLHREKMDARDRELDEMRRGDYRARDDRVHGRGGREFGRRPPPRRYSRSPPPRRFDTEYSRRPPPRETDTYVPAPSARHRRRGSSPVSNDSRRSRTRTRSLSSDRRGSTRGNGHRSAHSPPRRRRSPSPTRRRRRSVSWSRSPPRGVKRTRRDYSSSRSPPRRRRDPSRDRRPKRRDPSSSPQRNDRRADRRKDSPPRRRRSTSSISSRSRSPPRRRNGSTSPVRQQTRRRSPNTRPGTKPEPAAKSARS